MKLCVFCSSVLFCEKKNTPTVRERMLESCRGVFSLTEDISFSHVRYFFLSQSAQSLRSFLAHSFESTEGLRHTEFTEASPPAPLRMERGVVCEVTPIGLLIEGDRLLNIWRTCRGISVITPLSIRRGAGGEASVGCNAL